MATRREPVIQIEDLVRTYMMGGPRCGRCAASR